jgi:hypothetical protein
VLLVEERPEDGRRVEAGQHRPDDRTVTPDERRDLAVADQTEVGERHP